MLGTNAPRAEGFSSTWTWAAALSLAGLLVGLCFSVEQVRRSRKAKEAARLRPDYDMLDEVVVAAGKLEGLAAEKADLAPLKELRSRVKQAERRSPDLPFGEVVARIDVYQKTVLPDCFRRKLSGKRITLDELLELSRQQGATLTEIRGACNTVQQEIDRRTG
ncbi:hypothetical protein [Streptomyces chartreusis]|uniref:hypothetical protein n=1 Tax=Streptomyces chartreusis TaxID=1969 RepID=UPI00365A2F8D